MRRFVVLMASLALVVLLSASAAMAEEGLDQKNEESCCTQLYAVVAGEQEIAQTFTAGKSGFLSRVSVYVGPDGPLCCPYTDTVLLEVQGVDSRTGTPNGSVIGLPVNAPVTFQTFDQQGWYDIVFPDGSQPFLQAGKQYALVFPDDASFDYGLETSRDTYPGGN